MGSIGKECRLAAPAVSRPGDPTQEDWLAIPIMEREMLLDMLALAILVNIQPDASATHYIQY
ncbi:MAG: hypothetical protein H7841_03940 [Magnetospirillum sp. WYHS-4]